MKDVNFQDVMEYVRTLDTEHFSLPCHDHLKKDHTSTRAS